MEDVERRDQESFAERRTGQDRRAVMERRDLQGRRVVQEIWPGLGNKPAEPRKEPAAEQERRRESDRRDVLGRRTGFDRRSSFDRAGRLEFLLIDAETMETLRQLQPLLVANIDKILDDFFVHMTQRRELALLFGDSGISIVRAEMKKHWLENVFAGKFDDSYLLRASSIGKTYERAGLEPRWYMAAYCYTLNQITDLIFELLADTPEKITPAIKAVSKAIFLDMDIAVSVYLNAIEGTGQRRGWLSSEELSALLEGK